MAGWEDNPRTEDLDAEWGWMLWSSITKAFVPGPDAKWFWKTEKEARRIAQRMRAMGDKAGVGMGHLFLVEIMVEPWAVRGEV